MLPADPVKWTIPAFRSGQGARYDTYREYMAGTQPLAFATEKFRSAFGRLFSEFSYNRCSVVIKAHADRLQIAGFAAGDDVISQAAQDIWDANEMDVREGHVSAEAFGMGDAYVIVEKHPITGETQIWTQEAQNVRVHYSDDRPGEIDLAAKFWINDDGYGRLNLYFQDRIEKYITGNKANAFPQSALSFGQFIPDNELWPMPLTVTDTVPVFHFANDARTNAYGLSELNDVIPLQDALNKTLMDMLVAMEFAAFQQRVLLNVDTDDEETDASIKRFQVGIDRMLSLRGSPGGLPPSIAEFSAVSIEQWETVAENWDKRISRVTGMPVHHLTMQSDFASGRAKRIAEGPWIAKLEDRQRSFGYRWSGVQRYALRLDGMDVAPGEIRVNWKSAAPLSEEDELDVAMQRDAIGIPFESNLKMLGYEPDQIEEILQLKDAAVAEAQRAFSRGAVPSGFNDDEEEEAS